MPDITLKSRKQIPFRMSHELYEKALVEVKSIQRGSPKYSLNDWICDAMRLKLCPIEQRPVEGYPFTSGLRGQPDQLHAPTPADFILGKDMPPEYTPIPIGSLPTLPIIEIEMTREEFRAKYPPPEVRSVWVRSVWDGEAGGGSQGAVAIAAREVQEHRIVIEPELQQSFAPHEPIFMGVEDDDAEVQKLDRETDWKQRCLDEFGTKAITAGRERGSKAWDKMIWERRYELLREWSERGDTGGA